MTHTIVIAAVLAISSAGSEPVACELVDVTAAEAVLGANPTKMRTPVEIGDRGRYNEDESGNAIVQFAKGEYSVRISVTARSVPDASYLPALIDVARSAAAGISD